MITKNINSPSGKKYEEIIVPGIVYDDEPIESSFNGITSDAVVKAIDEAKEDMQGKIDEVTLDPSAVAFGNVHLLDEVTEFPADGCILIDSDTNGPGEMSKDTLLELTAQNALCSIKNLATTKYKGFMALDDADGTGKMDVATIFNNFAGKFNPNVTNAVEGCLYWYDGVLYMAKVDYTGVWDVSKFAKVPVSYYLQSLCRNNDAVFNSFAELAGKQAVSSAHNIDYVLILNDGTALSNGAFTTKCFQVSPGDVIHVRGWGRVSPDAAVICFLNADYSFNSLYVSGSGDNFFYDEIILIPSNASYSYVALSYNSTVASGAMQVEKIDALDNIAFFDKVFPCLRNKNCKLITSKILNTDGTTTTNDAFNVNLYYVADITKLILYGTGRNGTSAFSWVFLTSETFNSDNIISGHAGTGGNESVLKIVDVPQNAKYLAVSINKTIASPIAVKNYANDKYSLVNYDEETFTGCVNATLSAVQAKYPNSRIVVCTPLNNGNYYNHSVPYFCENNGIGLKLIDYVERIKQCASLFACPVIDLNHDLGLNPFLTAHKNTYFSNPSNDNLHPNTAGHKLIANVMIDALKYAIKPFGDYSDWSGKKALFIGDSITGNAGNHTNEIYFEIVKTELGLSVASNGGNSGTGYTRDTPMTPCILDRLSSYGNDYDLVVIFVGINDFFGLGNNSPAPFGELFALA